MVARNRWLAALTTLFALTASPLMLSAQEKCDVINDGSPFQLQGARTYLVFIQNPGTKGNETTKHVFDAVKLLTTDTDKIKNENGRHYLLLRIYAAVLSKNEGQYVVKRSSMGYQTNPDGLQNLLMALDSSATYLDANVPACKAVFAPYRQKFYGELLNKSIAALKAEHLDSAKFYVKNAQQLSPKDPRTWNVLTSIYNSENKADSAAYTMNKVIELSGTDTVYKAIRQQARYNIAVMTLQDAEALQGNAKSAGLAKSKALLEAYLKDSPDDANAKQALARALTASGDTAAIANIFSDMVDHPEKFTWIQLFEAGSNAGNARRDQDAVKLYNNGLALNPYHREALFNLANSLFALKDGEHMLPIVQRLVSIDPNNGNAVRLYAGAWQTRRQAEKDAAKQKPMTDSILYWLDREKKLDPRVSISSAVASAKGYKVVGSVENTGAATATYTVKFQFLDKDGKAVTTKDQTIGPVAAGASSAFTITLDTPGIIAYKYAPIP